MVKRINHAIVEFFEKLSSWEHDVVREQGMTLPQMHTLEVLGIHGAMRMKELAESMGITTGTLTVLVDRLEDKAYVRRVPHDTDPPLHQCGADRHRPHAVQGARPPAPAVDRGTGGRLLIRRP